MRLQQLDTELRNRGLKLTFREKQSILSQSGPINEVLENYLNPPQSPQLPALKMGGPIPENYISAPASTTSVRLPPMLTSSQLQRTPINNRPQREIDETRYAPIPYSRDTTAVESTYADMGALIPAHYIDKVSGINRTERLRDSMVNTAIENLDLSKKYYKKYTPENIEAVKALQRELVSKGLDIGSKGVDGKFGDDTLAAYRKSQNMKDLSSEQKRDECRNSDGSYKEGCAEYVSEVTKNQILGSAWEMAGNIESNGGMLKYNIYDDPRFKNVKTVKDLKRVTREVKATSKAKSENFEVGDAVGIYWEDSEYHQKAMDEGKRGTKNTHVGIVTSIKDGVPIISHNIHGKLYHEPYNHLTIGWIGSASKVPELSTKNDKSGDVGKIIDGTVEDMPGLFNVNIDKEALRKDIQGILQVESGGGKAIPTEEDIRISSSFRKLLGEGGVENVSTGIAKIKSNTLSVREKALLGFDSKGETFADDIKATTYLYLKHYMEAKRYADANPDLKLTENDLRSMAILGHNQGMNKLLSVGANSFRSKEDEVQMLRDLSEKDSRTKDITSTKFKYLEKVGLGALGDKLYDMKYPEGHSTYVGRVKSYGDQLNRYKTGGQYDPTPASSTRVSMPPMLPLGQMVQDNERVRKIEENQRLASQLPDELKYQGPVPDNGKIDYRYTDRRSSNFSGTPNMQFAAPNMRGQMRAEAEEFHAGLLDPGIPGMGVGNRIASSVAQMRRPLNRYLPTRYGVQRADNVRGMRNAPDIDPDKQREMLMRDMEESLANDREEALRQMSYDDLDYDAIIAQEANMIRNTNSPEWNNALYNSQNSPSAFIQYPTFGKPVVKNRSGYTKDELLQVAKNKDVIQSMDDDALRNTVLKPNGEVVPYNTESLEPYFSGKNNVNMIPVEEYTSRINDNIQRLNTIIANKNTSGVDYRAVRLDPRGVLEFEVPSMPGKTTWNVGINPGEWRGEVEDVVDAMYLKSVPGLQMRGTTGSVFPDGVPRKGTRAYESLNEYLKELGLGRVSSGFNSQTRSSEGVWDNLINSDRAVGYKANKGLTYGTMKTGLGAAAGLETYRRAQNQE